MDFSLKIQLVGNVGKKSHLACSLNSNSKLSLMKRAGTANAAGKDLSSLRNELSKLSNVLVIDLGYLVLAEDANLLLSVHRTEGSARSVVSLHDKITFPLKILYYATVMSFRGSGVPPELEGQALVAGNFFEIRRSCGIECGRAVCCGSINVTLRSRSAGSTCTGGSNEGNFVSHNLGSVSLLALIVGPGASLQLAANKNGIALFEIAADKISTLSPCNDVDEVHRLALLVLREAAIYRDREAANGRAGLRLLQLGVSRHVTDQDNLVETCHAFCLRLNYSSVATATSAVSSALATPALGAFSHLIVVMERRTFSFRPSTRSSSRGKVGSLL